MAKIKLVGAERYSCDAASPEIIVRNQIIEVAEGPILDSLLSDVRTDELNNEHAMFVEMTDAEIDAEAARAAEKAKAAQREQAEDADDEDDAEPPVARTVKAPARRRNS